MKWKILLMQTPFYWDLISQWQSLQSSSNKSKQLLSNFQLYTYLFHRVSVDIWTLFHIAKGKEWWMLCLLFDLFMLHNHIDHGKYFFWIFLRRKHNDAWSERYSFNIADWRKIPHWFFNIKPFITFQTPGIYRMEEYK